MNVTRHRLLTLTLLATSLGAAGRARSEPPPPEAARLFQEGRAALGKGDYELASSYFARSYRLEATLGTLLNLAVCEDKLGKLSAALAHLQRARDTAAPSDRRRPLIEERIAQLEARLPRLTVRPSSSIDASVTISLDERPLAASELGTMIRIAPGTHVLDCAGPHGESCTNVFSVSEGEDAVQIVKVTRRSIPVPGAPVSEVVPLRLPPDTHASPSRSADRNAVAYVTGGIGLATVVVGLIAGAAVVRQMNIVDQRCDERGCDPEGLAAAQTGRTLSTVSTVTTAIGLAGLGVSAYLLLSAPASQTSVVSLSFAGAF